MSAARIYVLPAGELEDGGHPFGECCRCGVSARTEPCRPCVLPMTRAAAVMCDDTIACERRRYRLRLRRLWDAP